MTTLNSATELINESKRLQDTFNDFTSGTYWSLENCLDALIDYSEIETNQMAIDDARIITQKIDQE